MSDGPSVRCKFLRFLAHHIEQRHILLGQTRALGRVVALAEQTDEQLARIDLHRQRCGGRAERNRPGVGAAVVAVAEAAAAAVVRGDFKRRQRRILADVLRGDLVGRGSAVRFLADRRVDAGEPRSGRKSVHRADGRLVVDDC